MSAAVKKAYADANDLCGDIVKVTPSSKVVGDFAQWMVSNKLSKQDVIDRASKLDFPNSVIEFFQGFLGQPTGGFPEPLRSQIIRDRPRIDGRPGTDMKPFDFEGTKKMLTEKYGKSIESTDVVSYCMCMSSHWLVLLRNSTLVADPRVFEEFISFRQIYGDLSYVRADLTRPAR